MQSHASDFEEASVGELTEMRTWNRQRSTEELLSFISGRHAQLEDVELGI